MNLFSLHGKWYENNENRLTSNVLFFLNEFRQLLLPEFLAACIPSLSVSPRHLSRCRIRFQVYDDGKFPDAEIILGDDTRILIESKIRSNMAGVDQLKHYSERLLSTRQRYPHFHLLVITQTDQRAAVRAHAAQIATEIPFPAQAISAVQWRDVIQVFLDVNARSKDPVLSRLLDMFCEELQTTMYNRIDIAQLPLANLNEVVLTSQDPKFFDMALTNRVFWPRNNFSPSQFVAYYFTKSCSQYGGTISHIARIKYLWHNATIDEVLSAIPEFQTIPDAATFALKAAQIFAPGNPSQFAIGITEEPILLAKPIPYKAATDVTLTPNILPGKITTLAKILTANSLEALKRT